MFYAYVIKSEIDGTLYYGSTENPERRLSQYHNKGCSIYTKRKMPWKMMHQESFNTRAEAIKREKFFKSGKGREYIKNVLSNSSQQLDGV